MGSTSVHTIGTAADISRFSLDIDVIVDGTNLQNSYSLEFITPASGVIATPRAVIDLEEHTHVSVTSFTCALNGDDIELRIATTGSGATLTLNPINLRINYI